jgi:membrane-associated phospholipid phosphatase
MIGRLYLMLPSGLILLLLAVSGASAAEAQELVSCDSPLTGDELRHPQAHVASRTYRDLAAVPASVVAWDARDWSVFGVTAATTATLMLPPKDQFDVRFQDWLKDNRKPSLGRFFVKIKTIPEAVVLAGYGALLFGTAWLTDSKPLFEYGSLSLEALAISQFYHIVTKLLMGREGPHQGGGDGEIHGPTVFLFPGGTPSGHASTAFALFAVAAEYWRKWPIYAVGSVATLYISMSLVYTRQHFVSDVLWGGVMGYAIGRWIVRHRSSRYRCRAPEQTVWDRTLVFPVVTGRGLALSASLRF